MQVLSRREAEVADVAARLKGAEAACAAAETSLKHFQSLTGDGGGAGGNAVATLQELR